MSDLAAVVLAVATAAGAWASFPLPLSLGLALAALGLGLRRPAIVAVAAGVAASGLAVRAEAGLRPPVIGPWHGTAALLSDPTDVPMFGATRVDVRVAGKRIEAEARGRPAARLRDRLAGEQVALSGEIEEVPASARAFLSPRHVAGRMKIAEVGRWMPGNGPSRLANGMRRTLMAGAESLPPDRRALYGGFVLGDDDGQPVEVTDDFRAAGLTHLLVVSGQNVAFVLALLAPGLRRLRLGWRLVGALAVLGLFGVLTRWEPSVLRAEAMAALALVAATLGRQATGVRVLALAVTGLLLLDPLLIRSLGFLLSVGASAGILLLGPSIARRIPGPRALAEALAVTIAAQVGVAPVLVPVFDGLPVAALPANLLAVPVAGPLMMWGLVAGVPAGMVGGQFARVVHLPTDVLIAWIAAVARWAARVPLGQLRLPHVLALAGLALAVAVARRRGARPWCRGLAVAGVAVVLAPAVAVRWPAPLAGADVAPGAALWRQGGATVLVVDGASPSPGRLLSALHRAAVRRLDVVVVAHPGVAAARGIEPVLRRVPARLVLAAPGSRLAGASVPTEGTELAVGALAIHVDATAPRLGVRIVPARGPPRARLGSLPRHVAGPG